MQKSCTSCHKLLPLTSFSARTASPDGLKPRCKHCDVDARQAAYYLNPEFRAAAISRATRTKQRRFRADPAYRKAFNLWGSTKKRTRIPPWVHIADFVPVCQQLIDAGEGFELDHVIPIKGKNVSGLHVPSNVRVVLKSVNRTKFNTFKIEAL